MKKLYEVLRAVQIPVYYRVQRDTGEIFSRKTTLPACVLVRWPDGRPCIYVDMYLAWRAGGLTVRPDDGGSLKGIGSELTHLVRYCARRKIEFGNLVHSDIRAMRSDLLAAGRANNTTINRIVNRAVDFLKWFQTYIAVETFIVGIPTAFAQPKIRLQKRKYRSAAGRYAETEVFESPLPIATPDPDGPISLSAIAKLWDAVSDQHRDGRVSNKFVKKFSRSERMAHLEYIKARRLLELDLMEALGCRPGELAFETIDNITNLRSGRLKVPTLKRREAEQDPLRAVPISFGLRVRLELFSTTHRVGLIARLKKHGIEVSHKGALLLNADDGSPMTRDALRKEFQRLRMHAGIEEKLCLRMFRHRFITNMVKLHLKEYLSKTEHVTYASLLQKDIRTILTRVMRFTGHRNPDSLLPYVHIALDELGVFRDVNNEVNRLEVIRTAVRGLHTIVSAIPNLADSETKRCALAHISEQLTNLSANLEVALVV